MLQSFAPELYRYKKVIIVLAGLALFLFGTTSGYAHSKNDRQGISYKTKLALDLDGDHIPETATVRQHGSVYQVNIHFTTGRPKLRLRTYVRTDIAGLTFAIADINNDARGDIVISSATSIWPVAVWVNVGGANFQRVNSPLYGPVGRYNGPRLKHRADQQITPVGYVSSHHPQAEVAESFSFFENLYNLAPSQSNQLLFEFTLAQIPPRGPPIT
jgi:hypothetical protein